MAGLASRESIVAGVESAIDAIEKGRALREKGLGFHCHPIWGNSVSISSGEQFDNTKLNVRYAMVKNTSELDEAKKYLVLCEEFLIKESDISRGYGLK